MRKLKIEKLIVLVVFCLYCFACNENTDVPILRNESVIINNSLYTNTASNNYTITAVKLENNLLTIKVSSSGCSADSWQAVLVDANEVLESYPVQRNIKLALENNEACLAVFEKEFTFNIEVLKENNTEVILNLEGWNTQINYK